MVSTLLKSQYIINLIKIMKIFFKKSYEYFHFVTKEFYEDLKKATNDFFVESNEDSLETFFDLTLKIS